MSDKENKRTCFKCGKSPASDNVKLFRFPKPGVRNHLRCMLWAKFIFPSPEKYHSVEVQNKLFNEHRMLCQDHFSEDDFTDNSKKRLQHNTAPSNTEEVSVTPVYFGESLPGPSRITEHRTVLAEVHTNSLQSHEVTASKSNKSTYTQLVSQNEKEKVLYKKCAKYMRNICQLRNRTKHLKRKVFLNKLTESNSINKLTKKLHLHSPFCYNHK
ncbi:hypothetical protein ACJJTC_001444 [Scirpophaga incertulas]